MNQQQAPTAVTRWRKPKRLKMGYLPTDKPGVELPYLRLRGRWLQEAGFAIGRNLKIEVSEGRLMIETAD